jgi:hypothetical protein
MNENGQVGDSLPFRGLIKKEILSGFFLLVKGGQRPRVSLCACGKNKKERRGRVGLWE